MPVYYNPGSCFTKISQYRSDRSTIGIHACTQGDYWSAAKGSVVPAAADGVVYIAEKSNTINNNYGYYVVLEHTKKEKVNGKEIKVYTIYAHLSQEFLVKGHQQVKRGQPLGYVGNSGGKQNVPDAKGLYFHFEIRDANYWISPGKTWRDIDVVDPSRFDLTQLTGFDETDQTIYTSPSCNADTSSTETAADAEDSPAIEPNSTITACTEEEFIVQVMGKDHPVGQRIVVLDEKDNEIQQSKKDVIGKTDRVLLSTLYKWDWCKLVDKKIKICLEVTASNGKILIPLSTHKQQTPLREDKQFNQIVPIIPCTQIKAQNHSASPFNYPALARKGYFYIFKENKPWRELEISTDAKGNPSYRDVDIKNAQYYDAKEELFKPVARKPTGTALKEIWVPSCFYDKPETYDFFYSEVQLSASRLNLFIHQPEYFHKAYPKNSYRLEQTIANQKKENSKDAAQVKQMITESIKSRTTRNIRFSDAITYSEDIGKEPVFPKQYFQAKALPPMRNRDEMVELLLNHPAAYLYDSENNYFSDSVTLAKQFKAAVEKGEDFDNIYKLELNALQYVYEQSLKAENASQYVTRMCKSSNQTLSEYLLGISNKSVLTVNPQSAVKSEVDDEELSDTSQPEIKKAVSDEQIVMCTIADVLSDLKDNVPQIFDLKSTQSIWGNPKSIPFNNALQDAQDREIYCIVVEDPHFSLRQSVYGTSLTQQAFGKIVEVISKRPFFDSAVLIHKMVAPLSFGEKENPLSKQFKYLDKNEGAKKLAVAGGSFERTVLLNHYEALQSQVIAQLSNVYQTSILADHLSQQSEVHYATAYAFLVMSLATLLMNTLDLDPLLSQDGIICRDDKSPPYFWAKNKMEGYAFIVSIINTPTSNLHRMLYTPLDRIDIAKSKPEEQHISSHNLGLGWVRPDILNLALNKKQISEDEQTNLDTALAAASQSTPAASGKDTALLEIKGLQQIVSGACEVLNNIAVTAFRKIQDVETELVDLTESYDSALAQIRRLNTELESNRKQIVETEQGISRDEAALGDQQQRSQQQKVALDNEATKQASYGEQITNDKIGVLKAETEIYFSKQWLREVNINDIMGRSLEAYKEGKPIKIGRIRLFQDKGAGMAFEAINFHHTRAVLRGKAYTVYIAPFIHNTKAGEVRGVLLEIPLEGLSNKERAKLYSRQTDKLRGTVPDEDGGIKASTRSHHVDPLDRNPQYELAFFYPEGSAEFDELTKEVTPEQSSLSLDDEIAAAREMRKARIAENDRALINEQAQLTTADRKNQLENERAQKQQQYNKLTEEIGTKQENGQKVDPTLISKHSQLKTEIARIDSELTTLGTNNPAERIEADTAYKEMLLADKELQEKLLAQSQEESGRLAGEQQQTHKEIALLKTKIEQAKQKLSQLMAHREAQGKLSVEEQQRFNKYRSEIQRLEQDISENTQRRTKAIENRLYRIANTGMFKGIIIGWQFYNLKTAFEAYNSSTSTKLGILASGGEVSLALADYFAFVSQSAARETGMYKIVGTISPDKIPAFFKTSRFFTLETVIRVTAIAQAVVGALWTAKAAWEIYETWNRRESTGIRVARCLTLTSAVLTTIAPFFAGSTFLLLSPLMLAGIVIGIIAAGLMYYFQTTELEEWLKNGPFSAPNPGYSYLQQEPIEAYYRLVNALCPITIELDHTPLPGAKNPQYLYQHQFINVTSYMANMIPADNNYFVFAAYVRKGWSVNRVSPCKLSRYKENIDGGKRYRALTLYPSTKHSHHNLIVKAQIWVEYRGTTLRFPAPSIVEDDKLNHATYKAYPSNFLDSENYWKDNIDNPFSKEIRV